MMEHFRITRDHKVDLLILVGFLVIAVFSLRDFFATSYPVAFHDLSPIYRLDQLFRPYDFPWDYKDNLGSPLTGLVGNSVYNLPLIGLSLAFGSVAFAQKVLLVLLMALGGFGFYLVFKYLIRSRTAGFVAGLCMMFNPFTFARWEYGHNTILLAYMVLPFAVLSFLKVMKEGGRTRLLVCGLLVALMIYASPQVAYMFILFALLYAIFDLAFSGRTGISKRIMMRGVQVCLILVVAFVAAFPFFYQLAMVNLPVYSTRAEEAAAFVSPSDVTGLIIPQAALVAFMVLALSILHLRNKSGPTELHQWWKSGLTGDSSSFLIRTERQQILFFAVLGFLSLFVALLVVEPFTPIYYWLFNNVPGFSMFREADKFFMLSALSLAFFLGLTAEGFKHCVAKSSSTVRKALPLVLISIIVLASSWQFLTGDIAGTVGTVQIPAAYQELDSWLTSQNGDFRIAFFPPTVWATTYTWAPIWFQDPLVALEAKPTLVIKSEEDLTQSASLTRWAYTTLYSNRTNDWGKLLSVLGVKYLILRLDADMPTDRSDLSAFTLSNTLTAWGNQDGLILEKNFTSLLVYENTNQLPNIYQANGLSLIVGDRGSLISITNMNFNFNQYPAAFLDDNVGLTDSLINGSQYIFFQGDPYWSLLVSSLGENYIVKSWDYAPVSTNPTDQWVSGDLVWYLFNGSLNVSPDGYIYTAGTNSITIPLNVKESGDYRILAQVYDGLPGSQGIRFKIGSATDYVFIPTRSSDGSYEWLNVGNSSLNRQSELQISDLGGPAAISKIAIVPEKTVNEVEQNVSNLLQGSAAQIVYLFDDHAWNYNSTALTVNPEASDGRLIDLSNSSVETKFYAFNDNTYMLNLTFQSPNEDVAVKVHVDNLVKDVKLSRRTGNFSTEVDIGPLILSQGYHNISIEAETGDARFNMATLSSCGNNVGSSFRSSSGSEIPSYSMRSSSEYVINAKAGYLAFLEAGNGYWKLSGPDGASAQICIFNYGTLFKVNESGQYTLTYLGLGYVEQGFEVAIVGTVLLALGLRFLYPKRFTRRKPEH
ncbi:MAG: hypothetical protein ABSF24_08235 [Candidatus Bathyarchaeia archaeon]